MNANPLRIAVLSIPGTLAGTAGRAFAEAGELVDGFYRDEWGHDDFREAPRSRLAAAQPSSSQRMLYLTARVGNDLAGVAVLRLPQRDNRRTASVMVVVAPARRRQGIGRGLYAAAEAAARSEGRSILDAETDHALREVPGGPPGAGSGVGAEAGAGAGTDAGNRFDAGTGVGSVPAGPGAAFASAMGYRLEQVDVVSRLDLPAVRAAGALEEAFCNAGADYELVSWRGSCPAGLAGDYARLRQVMSIDAPSGALEQEEERWDAERVREGEDKVRRMGAEAWVCAVRHRASGELVGHTLLMSHEENPGAVLQGDTLVLRAHRGRKLGTWLKAANLLQLQEQVPAAGRVYTWNAAENRPMLDINTALGFVPVGYSGQWQKVLG